MDIKEIIRVGRTVYIRVMGKSILYHICALVDRDKVVLKYWMKRRWNYVIMDMDDLECRYNLKSLYTK
jgi:hypothetical protein